MPVVGSFLVALVDWENGPEVGKAMKDKGLFCHHPYLVANIKYSNLQCLQEVTSFINSQCGGGIKFIVVWLNADNIASCCWMQL